MARKLPWAQNDQNLKPTRERVKTPDVQLTDTSEKEETRGRSKNTAIQRRKRSRSHSTSPPPGPPSVEPMREGFEEDDIWMIVEDEFEALAKTFTAHLHHAEYKKLVKKARNAPPKALPIAASPMSKETIRRMQRETLHHNQQAAVDEIGAGSRSGILDDNVDDPWRGTSIAGLIASGSQEKRSLKGIDRLPSSTRAAQGFARPGSRDGVQPDIQQTHHKKRLRDLEPTEAEFSEKAAKPSTRRRPLHDVHDESPPPSFAAPSARVRTPTAEHASRQATHETKSTTPRPAAKALVAKRNQAKKEDSREERLSQVPMFLI